MSVARATPALRMTLSGVAVVCCPHDREKRQVTTERFLIELGRKAGIEFDPAQHHVFNCSCCDNLFADVTDEATYCVVCRGDLVHPLGGPLPEPTGRIT